MKTFAVPTGKQSPLPHQLGLGNKRVSPIPQTVPEEQKIHRATLHSVEEWGARRVYVQRDGGHCRDPMFRTFVNHTSKLGSAYIM